MDVRRGEMEEERQVGEREGDLINAPQEPSPVERLNQPQSQLPYMATPA